MSEFLKPQSPLYHKAEDAYFYPLTTADQVVLDDGSRLGGINLLSVDKNDANEGEPNLVNADTLGGYSAEHYVRHNQLQNTPKAGFIYPLASTTVPEGFLLCDGKEYSRVEYPELFAAIGTIYGSGDGSTTFNVPNLQTRVPVGAGEGYDLGDVGGEETHTLTVDEIPSHIHEYFFPGYETGTDWYGQNGVAKGARSQSGYTGGDEPHNNMQPYTVVNYIIATGKDTGVSVQDIITGVQALPLGVEYGGTGATDAATARENLEITPENIGAMNMELLWENASPESKFSSQTISNINFNNNNWYAITASLGINHATFFGKIGEQLLMNMGSGYYNKIGQREIFPKSDNSVYFGNGYYGSTTKDDTVCIPQKIYGIKGVN